MMKVPMVTVKIFSGNDDSENGDDNECAEELAQDGKECYEGEEEKSEQTSLRRSSRRKVIVPTNMSNTTARIILFLSRIGAIKPQSYPIKTLYYYNKRLEGCGKCRFRAMYNAWPRVEETARDKN